MTPQPFTLETQVSPEITIRTVEERDRYLSYCYQHWQIEEILGVYRDELSAREGHLRWVRHDWARPQRKRQLRPKWCGHEVLAKMKQDPILRQIPVVIWTVSKREEDIERAYGLGASAYLAKTAPTKEAIEDLTTLRRFWERVCFLSDVA